MNYFSHPVAKAQGVSEVNVSSWLLTVNAWLTVHSWLGHGYLMATKVYLAQCVNVSHGASGPIPWVHPLLGGSPGARRIQWLGSTTWWLGGGDFKSPGVSL